MPLPVTEDDDTDTETTGWSGLYRALCGSCVSCAGMDKTGEELLAEHLAKLAEVQEPPRVKLDEVISRSNEFPISFPTQTARLQTLLKGSVHDEVTLEEHVNSAYPVLHERVLPLLAAFLHFKRSHGRKKERELYKSLQLLDLVDRLIKKRPIVFYTPNDEYLLRDGTGGYDGFQDLVHSKKHSGGLTLQEFLDDGHPKEQGGLNCLTLQEYMSYDEMKMSALLGVSSRSAFINDGSRHNRGVPDPPGKFVPEGVIVGLVGARFEREGAMEWQDCVVTPRQNTAHRGYGEEPPPQPRLVREWARLWGESFLPTWEEASAATGSDFVQCSSEQLFNTRVYKARVMLTAETLLAEAGVRAAAAGLKAYVTVVGLGLGVWRLTHHQNQLYVDAWAAALAKADTTHISHINFTWMAGVTQCGGACDGEHFPDTSVVIRFTKTGLHQAPLPEGTLLVTSFAWDSNAFPGNEYWRGKLSSSGDPAAACSSGVAELHNSLINPRVTAANLHVASPGRVEHVAAYARRRLQASDAPH